VDELFWSKVSMKDMVKILLATLVASGMIVGFDTTDKANAIPTSECTDKDGDGKINCRIGY